MLSNRTSRKSPKKYLPPTDQQIFFTAAGMTKRRIFYNLPYLQQEKKWIATVRHELKKQKGLKIQDDALLLCYFYSTNLQLQICLNKLVTRNNWFQNQQIQTVSPQAQTILKSGFLYHHGFSKQGRAIIIMNISLFNCQKYEVVHYLQAVNKVQNYVIQQHFIPGKIQDFDYIMDFQEKLLTLPISSIGKIIHTMSDCYSMKMRHMWGVNVTTVLKMIYSGAKTFLVQETTRKIACFSKQDLHQGVLLEHVDASNLQRKYGGSCPNLDYRVLYDQTFIKNTHYAQEMEQSEYYSIDDNQQFFVQFTQQRETCCGPDTSCNIY